MEFRYNCSSCNCVAGLDLPDFAPEERTKKRQETRKGCVCFFLGGFFEEPHHPQKKTPRNL